MVLENLYCVWYHEEDETRTVKIVQFEEDAGYFYYLYQCPICHHLAKVVERKDTPLLFTN